MREDAMNYPMEGLKTQHHFEPSVVKERITPALAKEMLAKNTDNFRKLDKRIVAKYAKEILAGMWELNGVTIKFNNQKLVDGQHRLMAVVESGVAIDSFVAYNLDTEGKTVDRGKPRALSLWLTNEGIKNANFKVAIARKVLLYELGYWGMRASSLKYPLGDSEIISFIHEQDVIFSKILHLIRPVGTLVSQSLLGALVHISCQGKDPHEYELIEWFMSKLATGEDLTSTDPVLHLRNKLLQGKHPTKKLSDEMICGITTLAWNKTVKGESCSPHGLRLTFSGPNKSKTPDTVLLVDDY